MNALKSNAWLFLAVMSSAVLAPFSANAQFAIPVPTDANPPAVTEGETPTTPAAPEVTEDTTTEDAGTPEVATPVTPEVPNAPVNVIPQPPVTPPQPPVAPVTKTELEGSWYCLAEIPAGSFDAYNNIGYGYVIESEHTYTGNKYTGQADMYAVSYGFPYDPYYGYDYTSPVIYDSQLSLQGSEEGTFTFANGTFTAKIQKSQPLVQDKNYTTLVKFFGTNAYQVTTQEGIIANCERL